MTAWLGVVSAEHVRRGVSLGIAQIGPGKCAGLARMKPGDTLIYYSAQERLGGPRTVRAFTAIGTVADEVIWQADEGAFRPYRRRIDYAVSARPVPIAELRDQLELTSSPGWGAQLRRGIVGLSDADAETIRAAMCGGDTGSLATEFATADESPGLALWRATNAWQAAQRAALRPFDLTHVQFVLLASLVWLHQDTPVRQRDLAAHAQTDPMMTSQVVRALAGKGLIERRAHPTDRRARALAATDRGAALVNRAIVDVEGVDRRFFGPLGGDGPALTRMLNRLLEPVDPSRAASDF
jgi:DNA-binding MarR family transcriptional regulator